VKIKLLDNHIANLIAAGEVVERPASVVKELLENAIDAHATEITVEIKNGGVSLIRVSDNGSGMTRDDAKMCIMRHATSKISKISDLNAIGTLGFRGEALAAIASVSKMRIMTKRERDKEGTLIACDCGGEIVAADFGGRRGTTVIVEELFANVPARRKFLRKDTSEAAAIYDIVEKIALSHPEISINLISDNKQKFQTSGDGKLMNAIFSVLGREFAKRLIEVNNMTDSIGVTGFIGRPDMTKSNRSGQIFFINGRYIKNRTAAAALENAFHTYIGSDKFPTCVLFINIHPAFVDVNVHPTKLEVKFSNDRAIFDAVYCAVTNTLASDTAVPSIMIVRGEVPDAGVVEYNTLLPTHEQIELAAPIPKSGAAAQPHDDPPFMFADEFAPEVLAQASKSVVSEPIIEEPKVVEEVTVPSVEKAVASEQIAEISKPVPALKQVEETHVENVVSAGENTVNFTLLGVAFDTYIIVQQDERLLMIDKHAAHERIIFEQMKSNMSQSKRYSQLLALPLKRNMSTLELAAVQEFSAELLSCGFGYEVGDDEVMLLEIPAHLTPSEAEAVFTDIVEQLVSGELEALMRDDKYEHALFQSACKAALKGGRRDERAHLLYVAERVLSNDAVRYCPHGRPVVMELSKGRLDNNFKRS